MHKCRAALDDVGWGERGDAAEPETCSLALAVPVLPRAAVTVPPAVTAPSTTTTTVADPVVVIVNPDGSCARTSLAEARKDNLQVVAVCPLDPGPGAGQTVTTLTPPEPSPYALACEGPSGCPNTMAGGPPTSTP